MYIIIVIFEMKMIWKSKSFQIAFSHVVVEKFFKRIFFFFIYVLACLKPIFYRNLFLLF